MQSALRLLPVLLALPLCLSALPKKKKQKGGVPSAQTAPKTCEEGRLQALRDYKAKGLKYYYYGIAGASKETIDKAAALQVQAISSGCLLEDAISCYNATADSIIYATKKVHLSQLR